MTRNTAPAPPSLIPSSLFHTYKTTRCKRDIPATLYFHSNEPLANFSLSNPIDKKFPIAGTTSSKSCVSPAFPDFSTEGRKAPKIYWSLPKRCRTTGRGDCREIHISERAVALSPAPPVHQHDIGKITRAKADARAKAVPQVRQVDIATGITDFPGFRPEDNAEKADFGQRLFILRA